MEYNDLKELFIHERLSRYFEINLINRSNELEETKKFLKLLEDKAPNLIDDFNQYLDQIAKHSGDDQEGIYQFGLSDGIRLMRDIIATK